MGVQFIVNWLRLGNCWHILQSHIYFHPVYTLYNDRSNIPVITATGFTDVKDYANREMDLLNYATSLGFKQSWSFANLISLPCSALKVDGLMIDVTGDIVKCDHKMGVSAASMGTVATCITDLEKLMSWSKINSRDNPLTN